MSRIKGKDTKPEMILRRSLHARGLRYRLHVRDLPGRPDLVFPSQRAALFVHGCFWHGHDCPLFRLPSTNPEFWEAKIARNVERDMQATADLIASGYRVITVWECALRGRGRLPPNTLFERVAAAITVSSESMEFRGMFQKGD